eukprot:NODE_81_length_22758_cov_0.877797.p5 type:complete len:319 gc:universal NODE_81_length_22758_cov_0.877797:3141-2185(-)
MDSSDKEMPIDSTVKKESLKPSLNPKTANENSTLNATLKKKTDKIVQFQEKTKKEEENNKMKIDKKPQQSNHNSNGNATKTDSKSDAEMTLPEKLSQPISDAQEAPIIAGDDKKQNLIQEFNIDPDLQAFLNELKLNSIQQQENGENKSAILNNATEYPQFQFVYIKGLQKNKELKYNKLKQLIQKFGKFNSTEFKAIFKNFSFVHKLNALEIIFKCKMSEKRVVFKQIKEIFENIAYLIDCEIQFVARNTYLKHLIQSDNPDSNINGVWGLEHIKSIYVSLMHGYLQVKHKATGNLPLFDQFVQGERGLCKYIRCVI